MDELNSLMERVETTDDDIIQSEATSKGILKRPGPSRVRNHEELNSDEEQDTEDSSLLEDDGNEPENAYECIKCPNFVGDEASIKDHVINVHLKQRLYMCDFCDTSKNDVSTMVEHMQKMHPDMPQKFSHAYGRLKQEVDSIMRVVESDVAMETNGLPKEEDSSPSRNEVASIKCPLCSDVCKNQADFDWHLSEEHPEYVKYKCGYCQVRIFYFYS